MFRQPEVSVVIPLYNHEKYIGRTIQSVLAQSYQDFELIIIDDGSKDGGKSVVKEFDDCRIKYVYQENQGAHVAINNGITLATGKYVSILNSDDIYHPDRLKECYEFLETNTDFSAAISRVEGITSTGEPVTCEMNDSITAWIHWYRDALATYEKGDFLLNAFSKNVLITTSNFFIKKAAFRTVGLFRPLRYAHDWDMLLRLSHQFKIHLLSNTLLQYRFHDSNTVHESGSQAKVTFEVNWLIADNLREMGLCRAFKAFDALKGNHYISTRTVLKIIGLGLLIESEQLLNFENPVTIRLLNDLQ